MSTGIPTDGNGKAVQLGPASTAIARQTVGTLSSSVAVSLNADTQLLRMYTKSQDVSLHWGTAATTTNYDQVLPAGQIVDVWRPANQGTVNFIEMAASGTVYLMQF